MRQLIHALAWSRVCAVIGQVIAVAWGVLAFGIAVPLVPISIGIIAFALAAAFAFWRLAQPRPIRRFEAFAQAAVDILLLAWQLYFSGGATNPFVSMLVIPAALVAMSMPLSHTFAIFVLASLCHALLTFWYVPLPSQYNPLGIGNLDPHTVGVMISSFTTAGVLGFFIFRMAHTLRAREDEIRYQRERELRNEGILAIATQAAATAHELNTPLSTIRTVLAELHHEAPPGDPAAADFELLLSQVERCRNILRNLVAIGSDRQLVQISQRLTLHEFMDDCVHQFHLLRPEMDLATTLDDDARDIVLDVDPSLRHALINLMSNAADASRMNHASRVELSARLDRGAVEFRIRDHGDSKGIEPNAGTQFETSKHDGLGLGLALAHSTAERLGGELFAYTLAEGGLLQCLRLPLVDRYREVAA